MPPPTIPVLSARITQAGLNAVAAATAVGGSVVITHVGLGRGIAAPAAPVSYTPTGAETTLRAEFVRRPVGSGTPDGPGRVSLQTIFEDILPAESGLATEMGLFLANGTLFAIHSVPDQPITWLAQTETVIVATTVAFSGLPAGAVTWTASTPDLQVLFREPFYELAAVVAQQQTRLMTLLARPYP